MEESKSFAVKQTQGGDDSGYSCTSTQSKYSQSASSGDSCFEERRSSTLKTTDDGKMSTLISESTEQPNQKILRNVSSLETKTDQESNNKNSNSEQTISPAFKPQLDQLYSIDVSELKQSPSASKNEYDESKNIDTEKDLDWKKTDFLQLKTLSQSYCDFKNVNNLTLNTSDKFTISETVLKELNDQEGQLKDIIESEEIHDDSFGVVVSMNNGLIINTSNSIHKSMGYPKYMWQGRSFIDYIHPKDRISFTSYVTSVLTDPYTISSRDGISSVTFLRSKNNDGFYCNMRRYKGLINTGYTVPQSKNLYQVCKLTITFKDLSYASTSSYLAKIIKMPQSQLLLIVNAQLIHSVYKYPEEKLENPICFITKHNSLFEWCYVDHLIISHFGYLPQNIIGRSIFDYYNINDLTTIKQFHENMTKASCVSYVGKPYQFKCQNGNFALVQTEWSNFVNPWSGRVEFVTGRHKVIQGPINPDITTPTSYDMSDETMTEEIKTPNEVYEDINKIRNKNVFETGVPHELNQTMELNTYANQQISTKCKDLALCMNCLVPLEIKVQPEICGSFSDHNSVMLGEISPHHNFEIKSGSETPPSYTQLNYNDNIQRFFDSKLKIYSSEELSEQDYLKENISREVTPPELDADNVQNETIPLLQSVTPSSSMIAVSNNSTSHYSEKKLKNNSPQPLTQKMLLRHNKKMEDDLVKQHKNKAKKNKCSEKQNLSEENIIIPGIAHGIKRSNSSANENKSCKVTKKKHLISSNTTNASQTQEVENVAATPTVARATQIWSPCQITRDSQTTNDLLCQKQCYNIPLSNNVMPAVKHNKFKNMCIFMDPHEQKKESLSNQLQPLTMPFYATTMPDHIPQNSNLLQPCLYYHNQLLLQPYNNIQCASKMNSKNEPPAPMISKGFHQVNREEVITSSDSDCRREQGSLKSSSKWMYDGSSFYSSTLREKTDSSEVEDDNSWPTKFNKTQVIKKKPFWMEDIVTSPDLVFRYQIEHRDINEILKKDMNTLNKYSIPLLVDEQFRQLYEEVEVNGTSKTCSNDGTSTSSGEDECRIYIGMNKKRKVDFSKLAMFYEENATIPPPTTVPHEI